MELLDEIRNHLNFQFLGNDVGQILAFLAAVVASVIVGALVRWTMTSLVRKWAQSTESEVDDLLLSVLTKPLVFSLVLIGVYSATGFLSLSDAVGHAIRSIFTVTITLIISIGIAGLYEKLLDHWLTPLAEKSETKLDDQLFPILIRGGKYTIIVLGVIIALSNAGYNIYSLLAGLGVGGIAIAMAARETLAHAFGGVTIFTDRPFQIGDYIVIDSTTEQEGVVDGIGLRSTRIRTRFDTLLFVPNAIVTNQPIVNISAYGERRRHSTELFLPSDTDSEQTTRALKILQEVCDDHPETEKPKIYLKRFHPWGIELYYRFWVIHYKQYHRVVGEVNLLILQRFRAASIELANVTGSYPGDPD